MQNKPKFSLWPSVPGACPGLDPGWQEMQNKPKLCPFQSKNKDSPENKANLHGWHLQAPACGCFLQNKPKIEQSEIRLWRTNPNVGEASVLHYIEKYKTKPIFTQSVPSAKSVVP
jgi:hypothetical protein